MPTRWRRWAMTGVLVVGIVVGTAVVSRGLNPPSGLGAPLPAATFDLRAVQGVQRPPAGAGQAGLPPRQGLGDVLGNGDGGEQT